MYGEFVRETDFKTSDWLGGKNIMTDLKEMICVIVDWIHLHQNRGYRQALVKIITNRLAP
jgi:hypothetical protein